MKFFRKFSNKISGVNVLVIYYLASAFLMRQNHWII